MPDNKLTDNEIIKALECCIKEEYYCNDCSYECDKHFNKKTIEFDTMPNGMSYDQLSCDEWLKKDALDLINRLQAKNTELLEKIEDLEANRVELLENIEQLESVITQIKAEAYKEVEEKIDKITWYHINKNGELVEGANSETDIPLYKAEDVHNLLKELVGE